MLKNFTFSLLVVASLICVGPLNAQDAEDQVKLPEKNCGNTNYLPEVTPLPAFTRSMERNMWLSPAVAVKWEQNQVTVMWLSR